ncbi:MAG: hypothetical protein EZS28_033202 [Streblomastix strix]|uniref:Uncharacterized protein n=1 Tax=Streblomastix strix TaxID=222440 RepID=A0A5J4ULV7_9EUKA|nr:MAG: hypothetical protein EZS28_033202 [Streblomastix strix]
MQVIHTENKSKIHLNDVHLNDGIKCYDLHDFVLISIASCTPRCQWNYSELLVDIFETDDYCDDDPEYDPGIIAIFDFIDSQVSLRTFTGLMAHKFSAILPTSAYPANADIVIITIMDLHNIILANIFNPTLFIELRAFRGVRIRLTIPPDAATHEHTAPN